MKRNLFILLISIAFVAIGCLKNEDQPVCVPNTIAQDLPAMTKYATDSAITATSDESGLRYQIIDPGTGTHPTTSSTVKVKYVGRLISNGQKFDESESLEYPLSYLITGWQIGLPKIGVGGKIKLIIPSLLAYGCANNPLQNQPLYFYVELLDVK